jgi:hypothetical protein
MTPLERGLTACARREGHTWDAIAEALHRDTKTLKLAVKKNQDLFRNAQTIRKDQNQSASQ